MTAQYSQSRILYFQSPGYRDVVGRETERISVEISFIIFSVNNTKPHQPTPQDTEIHSCSFVYRNIFGHLRRCPNAGVVVQTTDSAREDYKSPARTTDHFWLLRPLIAITVGQCLWPGRFQRTMTAISPEAWPCGTIHDCVRNWLPKSTTLRVITGEGLLSDLVIRLRLT